MQTVKRLLRLFRISRNNMKFRNIPISVFTCSYRVKSLSYCNDNNVLVVIIGHAFMAWQPVFRITFNNAARMVRFTHLYNWETEYNGNISAYMEEDSQFEKDYMGFVEIIGYDELKNRVSYYSSHHYLLITEDEYVEVLADGNPIVEVIDDGKNV